MCWPAAARRCSSTSMRPRWCRPGSAPAMPSRSSPPRSRISCRAARAVVARKVADPPVNLAVRIAFNPNVTTAWFTSVMGDHQQHHHAGDHPRRRRGRPRARARHDGPSAGHAADPVRDRDGQDLGQRPGHHGRRRAFALFVVRGLLGIPDRGLDPACSWSGVAIYLFFATAIGIFLGTVARSMPQLGLLYMLVPCR